MEARQTYENLDVQAFKNLNTKIEDEFLAGAVNYLTAAVWAPFTSESSYGVGAAAWMRGN